MIKNTNKSKERVLWLLCFFMIALVALFGRMFYWQIIKGPELKSAAYTQQTKNRTISPSRGKIYDTNGTVLAESVTVETISITPKNIKEKEKTAKGLAEILNLDYETILAKTKKNTADETIAKKLDQDVTSKVREWINAENIKNKLQAMINGLDLNSLNTLFDQIGDVFAKENAETMEMLGELKDFKDVIKKD